MDSTTITSILRLLASYFDAENVPYSIVGGISVLTWGRSRTTEDIDVVIDHTELDIEHFVSFLKKNGFFAEASDFDGFKENSHCTIIHKKSLFRIDFVGVYNIDKRITINEARDIEFQGIKLKIDSPESLVAHKLVFGAHFDIEDAIAVLVRMKGRIDMIKLNQHAERLGVELELKKLLKTLSDSHFEI